ncbi:hypothetical protein AVEN_34849-1 [Araneus ventricosus]|uniref:CCHC-type domain-containing protein n=1 Tax=Araneus ventricosus TaxID=182803 RepID=A0A4Y2RDW7_ARAVE|nr:hypothetical protein AVEN_34849-1 [Araneus ventricosus]
MRGEDTQLSARLMDLKDLTSALAYSMKFEAEKTASEITIHARSKETEDDTGKETDDKFGSLMEALEKLVNNLAAEPNAPRQKSKMICWKCFKKGHVQRECQANYIHSGKLTCDRLVE